jgi:NAD(P)-dependent dehydrogenase (short-subunit alcohol dehydrogenase family)
MSGRLAGKVALITGAARGISRAQAVRFAQEGAAIIALDICGPIDSVVVPPASRSDLNETAKLVADVGGPIVTAVVDVCDYDALQEATDDGVQQLGGLDVVCATAGMTSRDMAVDLSETAWQTMLDVNLTGVWHTCKVTAPHLVARGGGLMVLVSSIAGLCGGGRSALHGC